MRATDAQLKNPITKTVTSRLGPVNATRAIATSRNGMDNTTSMSRAKIVSAQPPKKPATRPTTTPVITVSMVATTPTSKEILAP
jgi:hypothetical protein